MPILRVHQTFVCCLVWFIRPHSHEKPRQRAHEFLGWGAVLRGRQLLDARGGFFCETPNIARLCSPHWSAQPLHQRGIVGVRGHRRSSGDDGQVLAARHHPTNTVLNPRACTLVTCAMPPMFRTCHNEIQSRRQKWGIRLDISSRRQRRIYTVSRMTVGAGFLDQRRWSFPLHLPRHREQPAPDGG